jgi:AcrR family transcriptional regulator
MKTPELLIQAAGELFAKKGFAATSVRDIAQKAGVNVAAVNYHFSSKENLYTEVFRSNWIRLDQGVHEIARQFESASLHELIFALFTFFQRADVALSNSFKVILTDEISIPITIELESASGKIGPPGAGAILAKVREEIGGEVSEDVCLWVVDILFTHILHVSLILSASAVKDLAHELETCSLGHQKASISLLIDSLLNTARSKPHFSFS